MTKKRTYMLHRLGRAMWRIVNCGCKLVDWKQPLHIGTVFVWKRPWDTKGRFGESWVQNILYNLIAGELQVVDGFLMVGTAGFIHSEFHLNFVLRRLREGLDRVEKVKEREQREREQRIWELVTL